MRRILLFAYGTLLDEKIQRRVFGRILKQTPARLPGWRVLPRAVRRRYPGIVRAAGKGAAGGLLELRAGELAKVDGYEDAPRLYRRVRVTVAVGGRRLRCWVYKPAGRLLAGVASGRQPAMAGRR